MVRKKYENLLKKKIESWKLNQAFGQYYAYYINQGVRLNLNRVLTLLCGPSNQNWKLAQDIKRAQIILFSILFFKNNRKITLNENEIEMDLEFNFDPSLTLVMLISKDVPKKFNQLI